MGAYPLKSLNFNLDALKKLENFNKENLIAQHDMQILNKAGRLPNLKLNSLRLSWFVPGIEEEVIFLEQTTGFNGRADHTINLRLGELSLYYIYRSVILLTLYLLSFAIAVLH